MKKILCVGDGFGKGHIWPMWPQLLSELLNDVDIDNYSEVGAGNEFICNRIIDACEKKNYDVVLVQWAMSKRLDVINNQQNNISKYIIKDKVYNKKYSNIKINNRTWWLSSGSQTEYVQNYHNNYISDEQHKLRSINYIKLVESYLKQKKISNFLFFSSYKLDFIDMLESNMLDWSIWCIDEGKNGMAEYGKTFLKKYTTNEAQPHPLVHLSYIKEIILPKLGMTVDDKKLQELSIKIEKMYASKINNII
jgi:hypothetical protein